MPRAAILDIDGTLVDSVYQHALTWQRAFARFGISMPAWRCHRHIGMGGDQLVPALAGEEIEREHGEALRETESELFAELIDEVQPLEGAGELVRALADRGLVVVLASSAQQDEVERHLETLGVSDVIKGFTTSSEVEASKPEPDLVRAALEEAGTRDAVMVGDSVWDIRAAAKAEIECIGLRCGGFSTSELTEAGASSVHDSPAALLAELSQSALAG
jgi:HAD superfamily hydrolase (TIGR01549 family)